MLKRSVVLGSVFCCFFQDLGFASSICRGRFIVLNVNKLTMKLCINKAHAIFMKYASVIYFHEINK